MQSALQSRSNARVSCLCWPLRSNFDQIPNSLLSVDTPGGALAGHMWLFSVFKVAVAPTGAGRALTRGRDVPRARTSEDVWDAAGGVRLPAGTKFSSRSSAAGAGHYQHQAATAPAPLARTHRERSEPAKGRAAIFDGTAREPTSQFSLRDPEPFIGAPPHARPRPASPHARPRPASPRAMDDLEIEADDVDLATFDDEPLGAARR